MEWSYSATIFHVLFVCLFPFFFFFFFFIAEPHTTARKVYTYQVVMGISLCTAVLTFLVLITVSMYAFIHYHRRILGKMIINYNVMHLSSEIRLYCGIYCEIPVLEL